MTTNSEHRLHALDTVRAGALLLGIVLHATMSFFFVVPARDVSQSAAMAVTFYLIHTFRMTLFFFIAGYFGRLAYHRRGVRGFLTDRVKRIVVPLTVGWLVLAPPTIAAVIWGLSRTFPAGSSEAAPPGAPAPDGFPLVHLWFLYYLCWLIPLTLGVRAAVSRFVDRDGALRRGVDRLVRAMVGSGLAPVVLAGPLFVVLLLDSTWAVWFGIPTPDRGLLPELPAMVGFGTAFGFGWLLHRHRDSLDRLEQRWPVHLAGAIGLSALALVLVGLAPDLSAPSALAGGPARRALYAAAYTISIWCWTLGLVGLAQRVAASESPVRRYLADASYWLYLVHPPIVFGLQVLMMDLPLPWFIKFPGILGVTLGVLLASYHYLVRPTLIGAALNGRRVPRARSAAGPPKVTGPGPVGVAHLAAVTKRYGGTVALDELSLTIRSGELLALLGPNGAGKSTAIGLWLGTLEPDRGTVSIMGGSPLESNSRLDVGVMMQEVSLAPMLTPRELIALTASYYRAPMSVEETVAASGIGSFARRRYGELSTGQKRQVQFALAIVGRPMLLFLDEPTVGLDVEARKVMWAAIRGLLRAGRSILLTTHYLEEAEALADRVAVVAKGRLIAEGSVDEMRALVSRRRISCTSGLELDQIRAWPGVIDVARDARAIQVTAVDAEGVVRLLLAADPALSNLEVKQASLAEAFTELTKEAA